VVTKAAAGSAKIDPLMALFNAAMLMQNHPEAAAGGALSIPADYEVM
jgi:phage terminase large subunit-like protein